MTYNNEVLFIKHFDNFEHRKLSCACKMGMNIFYAMPDYNCFDREYVLVEITAKEIDFFAFIYKALYPGDVRGVFME